MSIVALKRNSRRFQYPLSGGKAGFALNGCLRNIGRVGPTNLAVSVTHTPFRGAKPVGHGGLSGTYPIVITNSGQHTDYNNPNIIKKSVKNTMGYIDDVVEIPGNRYMNVVQKANENIPGEGTSTDSVSYLPVQCDQSTYIRNLIIYNGSCVVNKSDALLLSHKPACSKTYYIGGIPECSTTYAKTNGSGGMSSGQYIQSLLMSCPTPFKTPNKTIFN